MTDSPTLFLGSGNDGSVELRLRMANRHGLIAGATGTGKTVSLQVFMAIVKGDLSRLAKAGANNDKIEKRLKDRSACAIGSQADARSCALLGSSGRRR